MYAETLEQEVLDILHSYGAVDLTNRDVFLANLCYVYHCIVASSDLLEEAGDAAETGYLRDYFLYHAKEEENHDVWLKNDLLTAGLDVSHTMVPGPVVEMVGSVFYLIRYVDVAALLGYQLLMESRPLPLETLEQLEQLHGKDLLRTVRHHSTHDPNHRQALRDQINGLEPSRLWIVSNTAVMSAHYFGRGVQCHKI